MIDIKYNILELKDYVLDHLALIILISVGLGLLYPESQLLRTYSTYFKVYSIYFKVNNIDFSVVAMVANVMLMYSLTSTILKLFGKDPDEYLSLKISQ